MEWKNRFEAQDCVGERTGVAEWSPVLTVLKDLLCRSVEKMKLSGLRTAWYASNAQYVLVLLALSFPLLFLFVLFLPCLLIPASSIPPPPHFSSSPGHYWELQPAPLSPLQTLFPIFSCLASLLRQSAGSVGFQLGRSRVRLRNRTRRAP